jgi:uncharacterized protein with FMN-binding domain
MPIVIAFIAAALLGGGWWLITNKYTSSAAQPIPITQPVVTTPENSTGTARSYKDGVYTQTTAYGTPSGNENIKISLTVSKGVVIDTSIEKMATNMISKKFQSRFADTYKNIVVGKSLDTMSIGVVAGASLTSGAFQKAVAAIKAESRM